MFDCLENSWVWYGILLQKNLKFEGFVHFVEIWKNNFKNVTKKIEKILIKFWKIKDFI